MRELGHRATILTNALADGNRDEGVYDTRKAAEQRSAAQRVADSIAYRVAPTWLSERMARRHLIVTARRAIAERGVQILEMEETMGLAGWVQQAIPIPVCIRLHGPWFLNGPALGLPQDDAYRRRVAHEGWALRNAQAITSTSLDVLEQTRAYYGLPLEGAVVIPPPTLPVKPGERWTLEGCDSKEILFIGRFDRHKGGDLIIDAFAKVIQTVPDARLVFAGPDRGFLADDGRKWNLASYIDDRLPGAQESGRIDVLGQVPFSKLNDLRRHAMVTVAASRYEVFCIAVPEAMAMGCPIVAARIGGIPEIIRDGVDGLLHNVGDAEDLAAKLITVLENPAHAATLGLEAAKRCEQIYYPEAVASQIIDVYRQVLDKRAAVRASN
jgi:glycosyltransferase involved in cell wall biosynthesis